MGLEIPEPVKWLAPIVVGQSWPEGDETKLRELRDAWKAAAAAIDPVKQDADAAARTALSSWSGESADAFKAEWSKFTDGDQAYYQALADTCTALANACDQTALDIEYTKYMIIASLILLAWQIAMMIASAIETFGASTAGIPIAEIATRAAVQSLFKDLVTKIAEQGFQKIALSLVNKIALNVAIMEGMDAGIQGLQFAEGNRTSWDWGKTGQAVAGGVAGGIVGTAGELIPKGATEALSGTVAGQLADQALRGATRGAAEGAATVVGQAALTGQLGNLNAQSVLMGAAGGATGGAVGANKENPLGHTGDVAGSIMDRLRGDDPSGTVTEPSGVHPDIEPSSVEPAATDHDQATPSTTTAPTAVEPTSAGMARPDGTVGSTGNAGPSAGGAASSGTGGYGTAGGRAGSDGGTGTNTGFSAGGRETGTGGSAAVLADRSGSGSAAVPTDRASGGRVSDTGTGRTVGAATASDYRDAGYGQAGGLPAGEGGSQQRGRQPERVERGYGAVPVPEDTGTGGRRTEETSGPRRDLRQDAQAGRGPQRQPSRTSDTQPEPGGASDRTPSNTRESPSGGLADQRLADAQASADRAETRVPSDRSETRDRSESEVPSDRIGTEPGASKDGRPPVAAAPDRAVEAPRRDGSTPESTPETSRAANDSAPTEADPTQPVEQRTESTTATDEHPSTEGIRPETQPHAEATPEGLRRSGGDSGPVHLDDPGTAGDTPGVDQVDLSEAARGALEQMRGDWPELDRVLTDNPVAHSSLLSHPDSVRMLDAALRDVHNRLDDAGIANAVRRGELTPEIQAKVDSIVNDLRAEDPNQVLDKVKQLAISREIAAGTTRDGYRQSGFDLSRREDPAYQEECVDRLRAEAPQAQAQLNRIVSDMAHDNGGEASWRPRVKDRGRALDKVREYVEHFPDGDASMLVDVVGAKIRFGSVDELYRALEGLKNDPRLEIVRIKDRVAEATKSGNRSILMNVRLADGQVAELKFGLKSFEAPAAAEHPLYEVRRDLDSIALTEHRPPTPVESLIKAATEAHARRDYGAAWNREMAGSRLHEVLTDHGDVASIAQRLLADSVAHPTNVAKALADPATRDATIDTIGELADGRALGGRTLDEYRAAHPGGGPLFEPVDPSINTDADGRDRKAVFVDEAKRADPARDVGKAPSAEESRLMDDYASRLREDVHPAVEAEVRRLVEQVDNGAAVSIRTKSAAGILDKVRRMTTGSSSRPPRPGYRAGDVIDAVGARITTSDMHSLAQILEASKSHFGVGDGGRILEIDNMYASPKAKNPAYRVIPLVVRVDAGGLPYTFELQLTTRRASIAADLEHNTLFKPYVEMSPTDRASIRRMLAEAAALDQEETRWNH